MKKILISVLSLLYFTCTAQRNVILIIADDLGTDYCGFYSNHQDTATFPNIRKLLSKGVLFTNAMSNPLCSPTRAGILTGRYSFRTGVGTAIGQINQGNSLDTSEITIPRVLKTYNSGLIKTAHIGKWHLNADTPATNLLIPNLMGYDYYSGNFRALVYDYYKWKKITNGVAKTCNTYATTETTNNAAAWIKSQNTNPFFLCLAYNAPHEPWHLPPIALHSYTNLSGTAQDISQNPKNYYKAALETLDHEIGRLFDSLVFYNKFDSTDFIFIGDNGDPIEVCQNPLDTLQSKGTIYQGGIEVPFIISGPSVTNPGRVSNALVNTQDLFATIIELFGDSLWKNNIPLNKPVDSKSLLPIIKNDTNNVRDWTFTELFDGAYPDRIGKTIRNKNYKFLKFEKGNKELYNLNLDPKERTNLLDTILTSSTINNYNYLCNEMGILLNDSSSCSPLIFATPAIVNLSCNGDSSGSISLNINGTHPPFICDWGNGILTKNITNLNAGIYSVIISDSLSKKRKFDFEVTQPLPLLATVSFTNPTCNSTIGSSLITATGGTLPFTYLWNTGAETSLISNLNAGNYTATVSDFNGCSLTTSIVLIASGSIPSKPKVITGSFVNVCAGTSNVEYSIKTDSNSNSYLWSLPTNSNITLGGGTNTVKLNFNLLFTKGTIGVNAVNYCGTSAARTAAITSVPAVPFSILGAVTVCANQTNVGYSILPVPNATSYSWTKPLGSVLQSGQGTSSIILNYKLTGGTVKVKANNNCGASANKTLIVTMNCREQIEGFVSDLKVYPIPTSNTLNISFYSEMESNYTVNIMDALGQTVYNETQKAQTDFNQTKIELEKLNKGIYFMTFEMSGKKKTVKVAVN